MTERIGQLRQKRDALREALRSLPAAAPGLAFTTRVLARLDRPARPRRRPIPAWVTAAATMAVLVAGLWGVAAGRQAWQEQRRRAAMRAESAALARELAALHEELAEPAPVLYLGGNEQVDVVLDLSALPIAAAAPGAASFGNTKR
ncbi:MAG TPA: hypothetical protein VN811_01650 [Thermoanaerobaculia bacterium]|nr:hypothetical protein [Thermoanaerobaculia bacterium]HXT49713.1 hypothetical protein [Thermoanaerobaculia bacterium]